ncbi:MAG: tetratricopeptide repeat protein [bacterium]
MRKKIKLKLILFFILITFPSFLTFRGKSSGSYFDEGYDYKKRDAKKEQKIILKKLKEDKKRCDLSIKNTKALIDKSLDMPYLPELYLRLAELYIEKSRIVYFTRKTEAFGETKALDDLEAKTLKNKAIETYHRILNNYPDCDFRDKVHFFLAHEYRELGEIKEMMNQYKTIIDNYKESPYTPESYLLLGDYFFNIQELTIAQRHYNLVLRYPDSPSSAVALYKLGWCHINKAEFKDAMKLFEDSVTSVSATKELEIDTYKTVDIRLESLIDMAFCYCEVYKDSSPEDALNYFQKYAWTRPVYATVLEKLAYRYFIKNKYHHAAMIYRQLSVLKHDPERLLEYAKKIYQCVQSLESLEATDQDVSIIVKALEKQRYSLHIPEEKKKKSLEDYELFARDIITHLHDKAREKKAIADFNRAVDSYKMYLDFFKDSPVYKDMETNYAEVLFSAKLYFEAGKQYEKLSKLSYKDQEQKGEKLYSAILSYYNTLKNKDNLNHYQTTYAREGLKSTGNRYVNEFPNSEKVPNVLFNIACISYDEGKYDEAIKEFRNFVNRYPRSPEAKASIHLVLDAYNLRENYESLINYGKEVISNSEITDKEFKDEINKIIEAGEAKVVGSLTLAIGTDWDKGKGKKDVHALLEKRGGAYLGEQVMYAMLAPSKEKGDLEAIYSIGTQLITQYPNSPKVENVLTAMIDSSLQSAQFRFLANYLEEFAKRFPKHKNMLDFLAQAAKIRDGLGQYDLANNDYQQLLACSDKIGNIEEEAIFAIADNGMRKSDSNLVHKILSEKRNFLSSSGRVKADARLSIICFQKGDIKNAQEYQGRAEKGCSPTMISTDDKIASIMSELDYVVTENLFKEYMSVQLNSTLDNELVTTKVKLLEELEKAYIGIIKYKSPEWVLAACYRSFEINNEFGRFLKEAPLPDLTQGEKEEYLKIIEQKSQVYFEKANQYLKTCLERGQAWGICNPKLSIYSGDPSKPQITSIFSGSTTSVEITDESLRDKDLKKMHYKLAQSPNDTDTLLALITAYINKKDFRQSILIAQKTLSEMKTEPATLKGKMYNLLGVAYLYIGEDALAKDTFINALSIDPDNLGAKINLAGLYAYYRYSAKANDIYKTITDRNVVDNWKEPIHQKAKDFYYDQIKD